MDKKNLKINRRVTLFLGNVLVRGGATLWPGWSQDHPNLKKENLIHNSLKFYIYLPLKKNLGTP